MTRGALLRAVAWVAVLGMVACNDQTTSGTATITGPQDMAYFNVDGGLLLITSTDTDELRALDLVRQEAVDFVRAPNPIEALSVPVVSQPTALARDLGLTATGDELSGPYAYARSAGSPEISVVPLDRTDKSLVEARRLVAPGVVTAFAARAPNSTSAFSELFVATYDGQAGSVYSLQLGARSSDGGVDTSGTFALNLGSELFVPGEVVVDLLAVPGTDKLAIATRRGLNGGRTFAISRPPGSAVDPGGNYAVTPLQFPAQVRKLKSHYASGAVDPTTLQPSFPAGTRVFGVLDEAACAGGRNCHGIYAVDTATGLPSVDGTGQVMVPLYVESGLIQDLQIANRASVFDPVAYPGSACASAAVCTFEQLGVFTVAGGTTNQTGGTYFFDARNLRVIDVNPNPPAFASLALYDPSGNPLDAGIATYGPVIAGDQAPKLTEGLVPTGGDFISAGYQIVLPGISNITVSGTTVTVQGDVSRVEDGDLLVGINGCAGLEVPVSKPDPATLSLAAPLSQTCGTADLTLRAAGVHPYVVQSLTGYLGRLGPADTQSGQEAVSFTSLPVTSPTDGGFDNAIYHPFGYAAGSSEVTLTFRGQDPLVTRGSTYVLTVNGNFLPHSYIPSTLYYPNYLLPTTTTYFQDSTKGLFRVYTLYPATNHVIEIPATDYTMWTPGVLVGGQQLRYYPNNGF